jgi:ATP-binding cassette subfamily B protein
MNKTTSQAQTRAALTRAVLIKTIFENIGVTFYDEKCDKKNAVQEATKIAAVHETIENFSDSYNTIIGERGVTLSGGQKQRVTIARMLVGKPPVMIFDDSLSAVDTETDAKIRSALKTQIKNAAVIIISHRISTLMQADKILVLKNNSVEDIGSHNELIKRDGTYRKIFEMQVLGYADSTTESTLDYDNSTISTEEENQHV